MNRVAFVSQIKEFRQERFLPQVEMTQQALRDNSHEFTAQVETAELLWLNDLTVLL